MTDEKVDLSRSAGIVSIATAMSRATGLISLFFVGWAIGFNRLQDSYNLANVMPNMIFELIAGGILTSTLIPIFISTKLEDEEKGWRSASNIANIALLVLVTIALLGTFFSYYFVRIQTFLVPTEQVSIAKVEFFFRFFVWEIVFYGLTAILNGILQAHRKFTMPALAPVLNNLVVIATIVLFYLPLKNTNPNLALLSLAVGTTLGIVAMALAQLPTLFRIGWRYYPVIDFRDPAFKQLLVLSLPVVVYVASNQVALTISNALAWKFRGGMTSFMYAWRFFNLPIGLLSVSISTVLFPDFSEQAALDDMAAFKRTLSKAVSTTAFMIVPSTVGLFLLSEPLSLLVFSKMMGFLARDALQIAHVIAFFMLGLLPFSLFMLLNRVFYSLKDTITPMKVNALGVPLNISLNFLLVGYFQVAGLALGHSLTYVFTMSLLLVILRRRIGALNGKAMFFNILKFALISGVMGGIIIAASNAVLSVEISAGLTEAAIVISSLVFGGAVYLLVNKLAGTEEVGTLARIMRTIFTWKRYA